MYYIVIHDVSARNETAILPLGLGHFRARKRAPSAVNVDCPLRDACLKTLSVGYSERVIEVELPAQIALVRLVPTFSGLRNDACRLGRLMYILWLYIQHSNLKTMSQAILKWGNSLAFRIPAAIAKQMEIAEGAQVEFRVDGKCLVIERVSEVATFTRKDLVRALRKARRGLVELGSARGKEIL
jgi:antitoxin component of MazEF toxin-antitoxin module